MDCCNSPSIHTYRKRRQHSGSTQVAFVLVVIVIVLIVLLFLFLFLLYLFPLLVILLFLYVLISFDAFVTMQRRYEQLNRSFVIVFEELVSIHVKIDVRIIQFG